MLLFPLLPKLARHFKLDIILLSFKKASSEMRHATPKEGKAAYLFLSPNLEDPSVLRVAVTKYLSANE